MFLLQVNRHSKGLLLLMVIFAIGQLFINYKRGMVISPFFHYGMYSGIIKIKNTYDIFEIEQNGKRLRGQDFTPEQWDRIILPLQCYAGVNKSNELYETEIKRLLSKIGVSAASQNFISVCNYQEFENWYKIYVGDVTDEKIHTISVNYCTYQYESNSLRRTANCLPLSQLCR